MDLLTGATGFLGSHLAQRLGREGRGLRALVRPGTDLRRIPREVTEVVWGGLDEPDALRRACTGVDRVFHTAARVSGRGSREAFERDNVRGTEALLDAAACAGVRRFVHVGSAGVYGTDRAGRPITEATPIDPEIERRGAYAWSKAEADRRVLAFAARGGLEVVVVRPGLLYGPGLPPFLGRLSFPVPRSPGRRIVVGSPRARLPLTHVANACEAIALAAERGRAGAVYNAVDADTPQGEYLELLRREGVAPLRPTFVPAAALVPVALACELVSRVARRSLPLSRTRLRRATEDLCYDTSAARRDLGWEPVVDLEAGIRSLRGSA